MFWRKKSEPKSQAEQTAPVPGSYSIVSTMREAADVVAAFVAHHLSLDCDEVFIFLDAPDPEVESMLSGVSRCHVIVCDDDYWRQHNRGRRYDRIVPRQLFNAEVARKRTRSEWLVHIDSDEFLVNTGRLRKKLAEQPPAVKRVRIRNFERFFPQGLKSGHIFEGKFRTRIRGRLVEGLYGATAPMMLHGISGYSMGKTATRVRSDQKMYLHAGYGSEAPELRGVVLLHFDGFTPMHWITKTYRRFLRGVKELTRVEQLRAIGKTKTQAERLALFEQINVVPPELEAKLHELRSVFEIDFDPLPSMKLTFPGRSFDLSPEGFDRRMIEKDPEWFQKMGLVPDYA